MLQQINQRLSSGESLDRDLVAKAVEQLVSQDVPVELKAAFLTALAKKGETVEEIAAFALELRGRCLKPVIPARLAGGTMLDVVGTGGDRLSTFNISTTVALMAAAAGVAVTKHGNRASTSPVGSADVMEALGLPFDLPPDKAVDCLEQHGFTYFFAPLYHPCFRHIAPARKLCAQQGQTTIFNFLGPLLNPARPSAMLIGVPRPELCEPLARVLQATGVRRAMVVCGAVTDSEGTRRWLDELSPLGPTTIAEFYQERGLNCSELCPESLPIQPAALADLRGGDREVNARIIESVLDGTERGPKRDAVLLNAAAALFVAGAASSLDAGWQAAGDVIDSGRGMAKLQELRRYKRNASL